MSRPRMSGGSKLRRQLRRLDPALRTELKQAMERIGQDFENELKARAPRDQGHLGDAAMHVVSRDGMGVSVGYSKDKVGFKRAWKRGGFEALFQEFGTVRHAAQPFIRPAWRAKLQSALDNIDVARRKAVKNMLDR